MFSHVITPTLSTTRQQILSSFEPLTMKSVFYRIQHAYSDSPSSSSTNMNELIVLVDSGIKGGRGGTGGERGSSKGHGEIGGHGDLGEGNFVVSCFYCKELEHIKKFCPKLIRKITQLQLSRFAHVMTNN